MLKSTVQLADGGKVFFLLLFVLVFFSRTNSLLENQNCFIDSTFTELEQEQIKRFFFFFGEEEEKSTEWLS